MKQNQIEENIRELLIQFGEDPNREGLIETPKRVVKMYHELLSGYSKKPKDVFKVFEANTKDSSVTVINQFYSLCEHHMLPFFGNVYISYIPQGKVLGLSKFTRLIDIFSKRLQTQENLTRQIADSLCEFLSPDGCVVHIEAKHLCMSMRGVKREGITKTTVVEGVYKIEPKLLNQFFRDIGLTATGKTTLI